MNKFTSSKTKIESCTEAFSTQNGSFENFCVRSQIDNYINVAVTDFKREYLVPQLTFSILFYSFCLTNFLEKYQLGQPSGMPD